MQKLKRFICLLCVCLLLATCCFTVACKDEVTSEDVFKKIKTAAASLDVSNYEDGFTVFFTEEYDINASINKKKTNLGTTNEDGVAWENKEEKTQYLAELGESLNKSNYYSRAVGTVSYDIKNGKGYEVKKNYNPNAEEGEDEYELYSSELFQKDSDGKYYSYDLTYLNKTLVDQDYYMVAFDDYFAHDLKATEFTKSKNCKEFVKSLKNSLIAEMEDDDYEIKVKTKTKATKKGGVFSLCIDITLNYSFKDGGDVTQEMDNMKAVYSIVIRVNKNGIFGLGTTIGQSFLAYYPVNETENSGKVAVERKVSMSSEYEIKSGYDATDCPVLDEAATYTDRGPMSISFSFYVDGKELENVSYYAYCGDKVSDLYASSAIKNSFITDAVWYLDEECTIPLTQTTWTACATDIDLYTTSESLKEGFVIVGVSNFDESYYNDNVIAKNESIRYVFEIHEVSGNKVYSDYAYLNGARIEKNADITYVEGQINYLINIYKDTVA